MKSCCLLLLVAAAGTARAADVRVAEPSAARVSVRQEISIAHCLDVIDTNVARDAARCPEFLIAPLAEAKQTCIDVGGELKAGPTSDVWSLDADGDGQPEYAFELANNAYCDGAASVFDCGSLGCAKTLYRGTTPIGQISAMSPELIEVVSGELRIHCEPPCVQTSVLQWKNDRYTLTHMDVRGHRVEVESSPHGLFGLMKAVDLLVEPRAGAASAGHYEAGTDVAVIGTSGDYYYVSPCNACESGFVAKDVARALYP
jgi:hypothetical protein